MQNTKYPENSGKKFHSQFSARFFLTRHKQNQITRLVSVHEDLGLVSVSQDPGSGRCSWESWSGLGSWWSWFNLGSWESCWSGPSNSPELRISRGLSSSSGWGLPASDELFGGLSRLAGLLSGGDKIGGFSSEGILMSGGEDSPGMWWEEGPASASAECLEMRRTSGTTGVFRPEGFPPDQEYLERTKLQWNSRNMRQT